MVSQGAVEFLLISGNQDQAFDIAQAHQEMDTFASLVVKDATRDQYAKIAAYYETHGEYEKAAEVCLLSELHMKAVQLFLKVCQQLCLLWAKHWYITLP
jgi:WD repeat-containing protein 19